MQALPPPAARPPPLSCPLVYVLFCFYLSIILFRLWKPLHPSIF
jgi:hypothetical protein